MQFLRIGDVTVKTRLIEGDFPNYKGLIPDPASKQAYSKSRFTA